MIRQLFHSPPGAKRGGAEARSRFITKKTGSSVAQASKPAQRLSALLFKAGIATRYRGSGANSPEAYSTRITAPS
jgi:hypothetical protein